ncbi:MAG TPA: pectinesterase family protein, partial [Bacteroidales bacterium]
GWPTTWRMDYASTSDKLHLYEFNNSGKGADMSKRAKWAGLRAMSDKESLEYSLKKVLGGSDNWDPEKNQ